MSNGLPNKEDNPDLIALYQVSADDIAFFKNQQVSTANYGVLLYGALYFTYRELGKSGLLVAIDVVLAIAIAIVFTIALSQLQSAIAVRRRRLKSIRNKLGKTFNESWEEGKKKGKDGDGIVVIVYAVMWIGALIDILLFCCSS